MSISVSEEFYLSVMEETLFYLYDNCVTSPSASLVSFKHPPNWAISILEWAWWRKKRREARSNSIIIMACITSRDQPCYLWHLSFDCWHYGGLVYSLGEAKCKAWSPIVLKYNVEHMMHASHTLSIAIWSSKSYERLSRSLYFKSLNWWVSFRFYYRRWTSSL